MDVSLIDYRNNNSFKGIKRNKSFILPNNSCRVDCLEKKIAHIDPKKGQIINSKGEIFNRHDTEYCRADMNWVKLESIIREKYPNADNVNFLIYASSTGEEAYTMEILLNQIYKRSIPIKAFDISESVVNSNLKKQKEGIDISISDMRKIIETLNIVPSDTCFKANKNGNIMLDRKISDSIEFMVSNILDDISNIDSSKPTVLLARNMWPYVYHREYDDFCKKIYKQLAPNSLFVIGTYDYNGEVGFICSNSFPYKLRKNGFKPISNSIFDSFRDFNLIFEKK